MSILNSLLNAGRGALPSLARFGIKNADDLARRVMPAVMGRETMFLSRELQMLFGTWELGSLANPLPEYLVVGLSLLHGN
jgi:hypothetical protein